MRKNFWREYDLKLYRYRTIKSALLELDNGTFYFADPKELNDPLEGYLKIFWQGDKFAWEGLMKNFVCSLFYNLQTYLLMSRRFQNSAQENFLSNFQTRILLTFTNSIIRRLVKLSRNLLKIFGRRKLLKRLSIFTAMTKLNVTGAKWNLFSARLLTLHL